MLLVTLAFWGIKEGDKGYMLGNRDEGRTTLVVERPSFIVTVYLKYHCVRYVIYFGHNKNLKKKKNIILT